MTGFVHDDRLLDALEAEGTLLAALAEGADPDLPVAACPGLTVGETARHLGSVYRMVVTWIRTGERPTRWQREPSGTESTADYLRDGHRALLGELDAHTPGEPCPTWHPTQQDYGFWRRRMAHESTVHRVDVQSALGAVTAVPEDIAVDGVDEALTLWFTHRLATIGVSGTHPSQITLRTPAPATPTPAPTHTWLAELTPTHTHATYLPAPTHPAAATVATATVTAPPQELYLWLWGRLAFFDNRLTRSGDPDAIAELWALLRLATR